MFSGWRQNRVAAVRDRLVSFPASGVPEFQKIPFNLEEEVSAEFNTEATELLVQQNDGSLAVYDVARRNGGRGKDRVHRLLAALDTRDQLIGIVTVGAGHGVVRGASSLSVGYHKQYF